MDSVNIEQILFSLDSNEARSMAVYRLAGKVDIPNKVINEAIQQFIDKKDIWKASYIAENVGMKERSVEILEEAGEWYRAGFEAIRLELIDRAVTDLEKAKRYDMCGELEKERGNFLKAIEYYIKAKQPGRAENIAHDLALEELRGIKEPQGMKELHIEILSEHMGMEGLESAIKRAKLYKMEDKVEELSVRAIDIYEKKQLFAHAASIAKEVGKKELAISLYKKEMKKSLDDGNLEKAAYYAERAKLPKKSIEYYLKIGKWSAAASVAEENGLLKEALEYYEKGGNLHGAAQVAEKLGMNEKALDYYEIDGKFDSAARMAEKLGMNEKAKNLKIMYELDMSKTPIIV